jgi:hypothetical protein
MSHDELVITIRLLVALVISGKEGQNNMSALGH